MTKSQPWGRKERERDTERQKEIISEQKTQL